MSHRFARPPLRSRIGIARNRRGKTSTTWPVFRIRRRAPPPPPTPPPHSGPEENPPFAAANGARPQKRLTRARTPPPLPLPAPPLPDPDPDRDRDRDRSRDGTAINQEARLGTEPSAFLAGFAFVPACVPHFTPTTGVADSRPRSIDRSTDRSAAARRRTGRGEVGGRGRGEHARENEKGQQQQQEVDLCTHPVGAGEASIQAALAVRPRFHEG
jgi:hypothetical protein